MSAGVAAWMLLLVAVPVSAQELTAPPAHGNLIRSETETDTHTETETDAETVAPPNAQPATLADALSPPRPGIHRSDTPPSSDTDTEADPNDSRPFAGPAVELGYTHYNLSDGYGGGDVHAGTFGGFLPFGPIRLGGWAELGARSYALADDDLLIRANIIVGYQYLGFLPFAPYAGATATVGVAIGQRFRSSETWGFGGGGLEVGAELVLVRNLWVGVSLGYQHVAMVGSGFDLWVFRVRFGL
jgi:hypothetical protein